MTQKILFIVPMHISFEQFVNPPSNARHFKKDDGKSYNSLATDLPLGPLSMSAYIKKHGNYDVRLIDFNVEVTEAKSFPFKNFDSYIDHFLSHFSSEWIPDVIGVSSLFSPSFHNFLSCGRIAKEQWPNSLVIGGGNIATNSYNHIYNDLAVDYFDALCFGEGEIPLLELLSASNQTDYLMQSTSWITAEKIKQNNSFFAPQHNVLDDLDEIPFYDYDLCDHDRHGLNPVMSAYVAHDDQNGYHIMTSRGCPFKCTFCASHKVHGRKMRAHSLERVKEDLLKLHTMYGAKTFIFQDDHLMFDKERVKHILRFIGEHEFKAIFQNGLTLYSLDEPMLREFYNAGVTQLTLPVESGSEKVLKHQMKKPLKFRISQQVTRDCRKLGIYTNSNILIGMPGETKEDIEEARINLRSLGSNWYHVVCASPIVGSEMHEISLKNHYISGETLGADYRKAVVNTDDFKAEYIQEMQYIFNLELNFIYNSDIKHRNFEWALKGFSNVIRVKEDHFFAHYFSAVCQYALNNFEQAQRHENRAAELSQAPFWQNYIETLEFDYKQPSEYYRAFQKTSP